ncbi:vimentin-like [Gossypium australe]|uniref:Vimentin-like n=1 Tax=Gossypium australe TaxID=47621 RepID=A0A5B6WDN2_9ROSI|nr:vimentin-like [Gossypium australe]
MILLRCSNIQADNAYSRAANVPTFLKKLISITGMSEQWVAARIKQKGDSKCISWKNLRGLISAHPDIKKKVDVFALSIYSLVIFPKALGHIEEVSDLFDRIDKKVTPILAILAKTFRSLSACRRASEGRFIGSRQFIPATQGLPQCEFSYKGDNYKKKVREISNAWNQTRKMKIFAANPMTTPEYSWWWGKRVNDNIPMPSQENTRLIEDHLQVIPSELEIIKQDFEKRSSELGKKIELLEEEKMQLGLDVDIQKLEVEKLRKGKNKAEEDLDSLKTYFKKLRLSIKTVGLGKTLEQWRQEIKEEKIRADQWEKKFQDTRAREDALERSLLESRNEKAGLKAQVAELEKLLHQYRSHNSAIELRASLSKINELKGKIGELEIAL